MAVDIAQQYEAADKLSQDLEVFKGPLTLAVLLEQSSRIKEEVAGGLQSNHKAVSQKLLVDHILTITRIVKQLSMEIQDTLTFGTTLAVQNLDQRNIPGFGELRGRVARCDAGIAKLSADVSSGEQRVIRQQKEVAELRTAVDVKLKQLEAKMGGNVSTEEKESFGVMATMDFRVFGLREEECGVAELIVNFASKARATHTLEVALGFVDSAARLMEACVSGAAWALLLSSPRWLTSSGVSVSSASPILPDDSRSPRRDVVWSHSSHHQAPGSKLHCDLEILEALLTKNSNEQKSSISDLQKQVKPLEARWMASLESSLHQELQLVKQEYHKGFLVQGAIESLRQIGGIKCHLEKDNLQKDIRTICSKMTDPNES
ncbi:LOW QUALITY PROTEIN: protein FAM81A [Pholidichthys leucotaenia]